MRIVLVEPDRTAADVTTRMLEARNHEVWQFIDGRDALAFILSDPEVDAVITAAAPQSISGLELCWETRLIAGSARPIYVILMASDAGEDLLVAALDHGADELLAKPLVAEELYARLRVADRLATLQRDLIRLATTDSLTGMFNRGAFFQKAAELCQRAEGGGKLCAIMVDIDHFKQVNDVHGHDMGDRAICAVSQELMVEGALVGRLGGEEFAVLREGVTLSEAEQLAEFLRQKLYSLVIEAHGTKMSLTCSFGVSEWQSGDGIDRLLKRADMALYEAKISGRNRVVAADPVFTSPGYSNAGRPIRAAARRA
jgi:two-component system cell cycle response regulator